MFRKFRVGVEIWLIRIGILATAEGDEAFGFADELMDLHQEKVDRDKRHWREGGPGSGAYEVWLADWKRRRFNVAEEWRAARRHYTEQE